MIKFYQLQNRIINSLLFFVGKREIFVIYSPQRSFSNFFRQLIEMNLFINYEQGKKNLNYYKHNPKVFIDNNLKKKFIIFILYKEFNLWYESIKKNPADFFEMPYRFGLKPFDINDRQKLKQYHYNFFNKWLIMAKKIKKIEFINFREILEEKNCNVLLEYIKKKYNLHSQSKFKIPAQVRFSKRFNKNKILKVSIDRSELSKKINRKIKLTRKLLINNNSYIRIKKLWRGSSVG